MCQRGQRYGPGAYVSDRPGPMMMGPPMMGGPQMMGPQVPVGFVPMNCPHKRRRCCKSCRRNYAAAAYSNGGMNNGMYDNNNNAYGNNAYNNSAYNNAAYNNGPGFGPGFGRGGPMGRGGRRGHHGPIGLIFGAISSAASAVKSHQEKSSARAGPSNETRDPMYQQHEATRSDPVMSRQIDVSDSEDEEPEGPPPRYSFAVDREASQGGQKEYSVPPEKH